jgi:hypothetical protein
MAIEMVDLSEMVDLDFRGPPPRSTTFKSRCHKELRRKWWTWWTFFLTLHTYARMRAHARDKHPGVAPRSTRSTRGHNLLVSNRLKVVDLVGREVHHLAVQRVGML